MIYTVEEIILAIPGTYGILNRIAKKVGCNRQTIKDYSLRFPEIKEAIENEKQIALDKAENLIYDDINDHENIETAKWLLSKIGRDRGYVGDLQRDPVSTSITIEYVNDWRNKD